MRAGTNSRMSAEKEFLKNIMDLFRVEAGEHVAAIVSGLKGLALELPEAEKKKIIETLYREAHTLKGAARAVDASDIEAICRDLESEFSRLKKADLTEEILLNLRKHGDSLQFSCAAMFPQEQETVRISAARLDALLVQIEELRSARLVSAHIASELAKQGVSDLAVTAQKHSTALSALIDTILVELKEAAMLPFNTLEQYFEKVVKEVARDRGKIAEFRLEGGEVRIDKRILDEMKPAFVHVLRNAVDHGIESAEERSTLSKPGGGKIKMKISQMDATRIEITVSDDGRGIDVAGVKRAAAQTGLAEADALQLIFKSGVSTSPVVTDISGRGLGLAIVLEKVEALRGAISVETTAGRGTTFRMTLPSAVSTYRALLVMTCGNAFLIPTSHVEMVARVPSDSIKTVENRETVEIGGVVLGLVRLEDALKIARAGQSRDGKTSVVVLRSEDCRIAFPVDEILGEQEVMVKPLGSQLVRVRNVAGAAVLGDGSVVPVLKPADLLKSAAGLGEVPRKEIKKPEVARLSILVAEDSITARTLLKNILESAGYRVETAVDGTDALTKLKEGEYDLVVSDVDMPRMNGFELTAKIRADRNLAELPVILVTALEKREDRERGMEVGANAYIVKSSFDQSNLLETIRRFI